jgi:hypothetical protein
MKDILIIGCVGLLWEVMAPDRRDLLTVVLFALLVVAAIARSPRTRDIVVICGVGLLSETIPAGSRNGITIALFGLPLFRLLSDTLTHQRSSTSGGPRRVAWSSVGPRRVHRRLVDGLAGLGGRIKTREFAYEFVAIIGMLSLGVGVAIYLTQGLGVSRDIIGYGALSYALGAVGFKGLLYSGLVVPVLHRYFSPLWLATAHGFISALSELGAAALFFLLVIPEVSLPELIGFGATAGIVEALIIPLMSIGGIDVLSGTPVEKNGAEQWQDMGATPLAVMVFPIVERALTLVQHTSSRALVYASMVLGNGVPALLAVSLFAAVDGVAYYALLKKWKVLSFEIAIRYYAFLAVSAGILTLVFIELHVRL